MGVTKQYANVAKELDKYCSLNGSKYLAANIKLLVSGFERCTRSYGGAEEFFEVMRGGEKFYVKESDLLLSAEDASAIKQLEGDAKENFAKYAMQASLVVRQRELQSLLDAVKSHKKHGLTVTSSRIYDESEYTEGTSLAIEVLNPTDKVVKYIWFTVIGYNAVGDPVSDRMRGKSSITVKGIGPIEKDHSGSYSWKYFWHTDLVETFKLSKIKVQYMDGSTKQIDNIKSITLNSAQRQTWSEIDS